jgi:fluoride exporter
VTAVFIALLVCAAGGVGAAARLVLDGLIRARTRSTYPLATTIINLTGSLLLGLLTGLTAGHLLPEPWQIIAGTGLLGGYTTFSTASFETVSLLEDRRYLAAALNGLGTLIVCICAAAAGLIIGLAITR